MSVESEWIWMDGEFVPFDQAKVHVLTHTLHYGLGVFEGIRCYEQPGGGGGVFRLDEHLTRLFDSAKMCGIEMPFDQATLTEACLETLRRNDLVEAYIRPLVFLGEGTMGLGARDNTVHVVIAAWKWGAYLGEAGLRDGISVGTSSFARHSVGAVLQRAKVVGHYVNSILARYEANDNGFDEAIMLDAQGFVAEGTGENLFAIRGGVVKTPSVTNILAGITRRTVVEILEREGTEVVETFFGRDALYVSDEVFLTGTAAEITPVRSVDRREVGTGRPGPMTRELQSIYSDLIHGRLSWARQYITTY